MDDLKIPLQQAEHNPRHTWPMAMGARPANVSKALPIYYSLRGVMAHRVRSGQLFQDKQRVTARGRFVFVLWCGQHGTIGNAWGRLAAVPPANRPLCGTCEGRAVGAGYPGIAILQQRYELLYSPREGRADPPAQQMVSA